MHYTFLKLFFNRLEYLQQMDDIITTLKKLFNEGKLKKSPFARASGISRNTLDWWLKGKSSPTLEDAKKLSDVLSTLPLDDTNYQGEGEAPTPKKGNLRALPNDLIPFYDAAAVGGQALLADQTPISVPAEYINPGTWLRSATGSLRVYGNSMFPKYPAGSIIAFKENKSGVIIWGEDYVIELEDRRIVKRLEKSEIKEHIKAVSYNVNKDNKYIYDPIDIPMTAVKRLYMVLGMVLIEASI